MNALLEGVPVRQVLVLDGVALSERLERIPGVETDSALGIDHLGIVLVDESGGLPVHENDTKIPDLLKENVERDAAYWFAPTLVFLRGVYDHTLLHVSLYYVDQGN